MKAALIHSPLDDLAFDVVAVLHEKAQALEAYAKYLEDAQGDEEIRDLFEEMRRTDREHVIALKEALGRLLEEEAEEAAYDAEDEEDEDLDDEVLDEDGGEEAGGPMPRRGESTPRR
jgi:hypothetical protein